MDITTNQYLSTAPWTNRQGPPGPRRGAGPGRLRRRERRAEARPAIDIGDTTVEAASFYETTPEPVKETETAENIENTKKSVNAIRTAEIYIYTSTDEAGIWGQPDYADLWGDPGGNEHCV